MKRSDLAAAAFWGEGFCLDCEARLTEAETTALGACPECGSDAVYSAEFLLRAAAFVDEDDEGGEDDVA